jgi:hypothetical protein
MQRRKRGQTKAGPNAREREKEREYGCLGEMQAWQYFAPPWQELGLYPWGHLDETLRDRTDPNWRTSVLAAGRPLRWNVR